MMTALASPILWTELLGATSFLPLRLRFRRSRLVTIFCKCVPSAQLSGARCPTVDTAGRKETSEGHGPFTRMFVLFVPVVICAHSTTTALPCRTRMRPRPSVSRTARYLIPTSRHEADCAAARATTSRRNGCPSVTFRRRHPTQPGRECPDATSRRRDARETCTWEGQRQSNSRRSMGDRQTQRSRVL